MVVNLRSKRFWRGIALSALGLVLILAVAQRIHFPIKQDSASSSSQQQLENTIVNKLNEKRVSKNFFADYRMERESMRGQQLEMLRNIVNDSGADRVAREAASSRMVQITEEMEKEMKVENLVKSRGFNDCVLISEPASATLVVSASRLSSEQEEDLRQLVGKPAKNTGGKVFVTLIEP